MTGLSAVTLFNSHTEHMRNAGLDELQVGIKLGRRNHHLGCAAGTTLMAESKEELKSPLVRVREEGESVSLKLNTKKTKGKQSHHFMANRRGKGKGGSSDRFPLLGL